MQQVHAIKVKSYEEYSKMSFPIHTRLTKTDWGYYTINLSGNDEGLWIGIFVTIDWYPSCCGLRLSHTGLGTAVYRTLPDDSKELQVIRHASVDNFISYIKTVKGSSSFIFTDVKGHTLTKIWEWILGYIPQWEMKPLHEQVNKGTGNVICIYRVDVKEKGDATS